jgi:hypothetical protein
MGYYMATVATVTEDVIKIYIGTEEASRKDDKWGASL